MLVVVKYPGEEAKIQDVDPEQFVTGWLAYLSGIVGGKLELLRLGEKFDMWLNREGKQLNFPPNLLTPNDIICGPVVVTGHNGEETAGLSSSEARKVCEMLDKLMIL